MTMQPAMWSLTCDHPSCDMTGVHEFRGGLKMQARQDGWQLDVKKDGSPARRGGKDYCPNHLRGEA